MIEATPPRKDLPYVTIDANMQVTPSEFPDFPDGKNGGPYVTRDGVMVEVGEVQMAADSTSIPRMEAALGLQAPRTDRHFLLSNLCRELYRLRAEPEMRVKFLRYARMHLDEFQFLRGGLKRDIEDVSGVWTFQLLATVLTEDGAFDEAIGVCEQAKTLGLVDGTKSGFDGRIARIRKKQAQAKGPSGHVSQESRE